MLCKVLRDRRGDKRRCMESFIQHYCIASNIMFLLAIAAMCYKTRRESGVRLTSLMSGVPRKVLRDRLISVINVRAIVIIANVLKKQCVGHE